MSLERFPRGLRKSCEFRLIEALLGRRSRRFSLGASIPDGPLAFTSRTEPLPLAEQEQMMVLIAAAGTVPSIFCLMYLQAHHLDLQFYDHHFKPGAYLETHAHHMERWHPKGV